MSGDVTQFRNFKNEDQEFSKNIISAFLPSI